VRCDGVYSYVRLEKLLGYFIEQPGRKWEIDRYVMNKSGYVKFLLVLHPFDLLTFFIAATFLERPEKWNKPSESISFPRVGTDIFQVLPQRWNRGITLLRKNQTWVYHWCPPMDKEAFEVIEKFQRTLHRSRWEFSVLLMAIAYDLW